MKKQFIILAASVLLLIVLSGCGESFATGEVFANSKALVEGVNVPSIDGILFADNIYR